jgi:tryptophanyl-tRNA synthetase
LLAQLRAAVGLRPFVAASTSPTAGAARSKAAAPQFKQYRDTDGKFYFKFVDGDGRVLLQSRGHASPRDAGQLIARLKREGAGTLQRLEQRALGLAGDVVGELADDALGLEAVVEALTALAESDA